MTGVVVTFSVTAGGGTLSSTTATTEKVCQRPRCY